MYDIKGVLEQIFDLKPFYILCSYNFSNLSLVHNPIWVKDMVTQKEMLDYFMEAGYNLFAYKTDENKKYLQTGYFLFASRKVLEIS